MRSGIDSRGPTDKRQILIVDDHSLMRRGLTGLIDGEPDLVVCASVATHREGIDALATARPDLVIADISLGGGDGLSLVAEIRANHARLPILVLSMHEATSYAEKALRAGANGYVSKKEMNETVLTAIRSLLDGQRFVGKVGKGDATL